MFDRLDEPNIVRTFALRFAHRFCFYYLFVPSGGCPGCRLCCKRRYVFSFAGSLSGGFVAYLWRRERPQRSNNGRSLIGISVRSVPPMPQSCVVNSRRKKAQRAGSRALTTRFRWRRCCSDASPAAIALLFACVPIHLALREFSRARAHTHTLALSLDGF